MCQPMQTKDIVKYKEAFDMLQAIAYKDIIINGICVRNLGIHLLEWNPEWNVKKHKHSFFEFHYVSGNRVYTAINGVEREINEGHFYIMPPGTYHSHRQEQGKGHTGFALRWEFVKLNQECSTCKNTCSDVELIFRNLSNASSYPVADAQSVVFNGMTRLLLLAEQNCGVIQLQLAFFDLILTLNQFYSEKNCEHHEAINTSFLENRIVNSSVKFIEENYNQEIEVEDVSNSVHLSYSHLSRLFKKHTGETINYRLNRVRLVKAQQLLMCSDKSIAQIAREVGFNSEYYFSSIFKKTYGISPGSYRGSKNNLSE